MSNLAASLWDDPTALAELTAASRQANVDALVSPGHLAHYLDGDYNPRPHLDLISENLSDLACGNIRRLMIMLPPQTGKSQLAAVWTPFWWLLRNPKHRIVIGSYGQSLAMNRGRSIRRLVNLHGWRWGAQLAAGAAQISEWELETGGGIKSVGFGSGITGFPADFGIIDDPVKSRAEADSLTFRNRTWDWYSGDFVSRLAPGAPTVVIGTPWHDDDLMHRCLERDGEESEGGQWRVIRLHAFAEADDAAGRESGAPLWHPRLAIDDVAGCASHWNDKRSSSTARDWASLYMLNPRPTGDALVTYELLRERRHLRPDTEPIKSAVAIDPSGGGRDTAGIIGGFLGNDQRLYVTHDSSMVGPSDQWSRRACELAADLDAEFIVVEKNFGGDMAKLVVRTAWTTLAQENPDAEKFKRLPPQVRLVTAKKGKLLRAEPIAQQIAEDRVRFGAYLPDVESEWATWRPTESDSPGRLDASCYLAYALLPVPGAGAVVSGAVGVRQSQVRQSGRPRITRGRP